jgi:hypothetical protein
MTSKNPPSSTKKIKKTSKKESAPEAIVGAAGSPAQPFRMENLIWDAIIVGDHIKYNLFLLSKAIIFAKAFEHLDYDASIEIANKAMLDLDLVSSKAAKKETE